MRYFLHLAYLGTKYSGWQRQSNTNNSIQQVIEDVLSKMTKKPISLMGCGRTDSGVHAAQYFAHFDYDQEWAFDPVERFNRMLPKDITIYEMIKVHERAHSRYDATKRSYEYHMHLENNPYLSTTSSYYKLYKLDFGLIHDGLNIIHNVEDFRHLCLTPEKFKNTNCKMYQCHMEISQDRNRICFFFTANRFLKSMIRIIVSRLLALGEGKITLETFQNSLYNNQNLAIRTLAFPQGLHLTKIEYPYLERETKPTK